MFRHTALIAALAGLLAGAAAPASAVELSGPHCDLKSPPASAAVESLQGTTLALYPPEADERFSGCRSIWAIVNGGVAWQKTVQYADGKPKLYRSLQNDPAGIGQLWCSYEGDRVVEVKRNGRRSAEDCPAVNELGIGE